MREHPSMSSFDDRAREWDTPERRWRAEAVAATIRESVALTPTMRVIDIGAGTGLLGLALAGDIGELVLAEPSEGMLEVAREKLADTGLTHASALRFDLQVDQPPGGPFDLAVSLLVLHHLEDTQAALSAIHDLLRPGGRIALADLDEEDGSYHEPDAEGIHHKGFDRAALADLARAAGFTAVEARSAAEIEHRGHPFTLFLLLGTRP